MGDLGEMFRDAHRISIRNSNYLFSTKKYVIKNLEITTIRKIAGSVFSPVFVTGVLDMTKDDVLPFFVDDKDIPELTQIVRLERAREVAEYMQLEPM